MRKCTEKSLNSESSAETDIDYIYIILHISEIQSHLHAKQTIHLHIKVIMKQKILSIFIKHVIDLIVIFTKLFCFIVTLSSISSQKNIENNSENV